MMISAKKHLIRTTWAQVVPIADQAAALFYQRLFEIDPSARDLFRATDMVQQRKKLLQVLGIAVSSLDNLGALVKTVEDLGRRHAGYGVKDEHYDSVGAALLWTLQQGLGSAWTAEVAAAWTEVYSLLSGIMRRAQQEAALGISKTAA
jgi:hemoglobin-like flavoprotein